MGGRTPQSSSMFMNGAYPTPMSQITTTFDNTNNNSHNSTTTLMSGNTRNVPIKLAGVPRSALTLGTTHQSDVMRKVQKEMGLPSTTTTANAATNHKANNNFTNNTIHPVAVMSEGSNSNMMNRDSSTVNDHALFQSANTTTPAVVVEVREKLHAALQRGDESVPIEVKGDLSVTIHDPSATAIQLILDSPDNSFTYRCHARVDKAAFTERHILVAVGNKPLPS
uniref:Coatomer subunit delta n=1 Tax=Lygus hesperus TaxID=30085 RepID=A0A146LGW8_LYGHE